MAEVIAALKLIADSNTSLIAGAVGVFVAVIFIWMRVRNMTISEYDSTYTRQQEEVESLRQENRALREEVAGLQNRLQQMFDRMLNNFEDSG